MNEAKKELEFALAEEKDKMRVLQEESKRQLKRGMTSDNYAELKKQREAAIRHYDEAIKVLNSNGPAEMSDGYR